MAYITDITYALPVHAGSDAVMARICPGYDTFTTTGVNILNMFKLKVPYICALRILPDKGDFATDLGVSLAGYGPDLHGSITGPIRDREPRKCDLGLRDFKGVQK